MANFMLIFPMKQATPRPSQPAQTFADSPHSPPPRTKSARAALPKEGDITPEKPASGYEDGYMDADAPLARAEILQSVDVLLNQVSVLIVF
jgi:hypothetical protein